jgi:geranylgeranyl reductase family protein
MSDFHVAIVGGGPAGSWAAFLLARAGARIAIIDGSHPREKPCGGGLSARALRLLEPLRGGAAPAGNAIAVSTFSDGQRGVDVPLERNGAETPPLLVSSRRTFDLSLLNAATEAGSELVGERVTAIEAGRAGWTLKTVNKAITADWLIGADGANSLVKRSVSEPFPRSALSIASGYYVRGRTSPRIDVAFTSEPAGYLWSFPRPDHLAIGACGQANETSSTDLLQASAAWIRQHTDAANEDMSRYSWPIPSLSERQLDAERPAGERWLLIGDAAGLVDPITREGLYFALASSRLAAESLMKDRVADRYIKRVRGELHTELRKAARLKARFFHSAFTGLLLRALEESPQIRRVMADLVTGAQPYRGLMPPRRRVSLQRRKVGAISPGIHRAHAQWRRDARPSQRSNATRCFPPPVVSTGCSRSDTDCAIPR